MMPEIDRMIKKGQLWYEKDVSYASRQGKKGKKGK